MTSSYEFWEKKHRSATIAARRHKPNVFALEVAGRIAKGGHLLDLGCGQGQDAVFFARAGARVTAVDFSPFALLQFESLAQALNIRQVELDLRQTPYPFDDAQFDVVYAHLSLHYFNRKVTQSIFSEVARLLRPKGLFLSTFNSVKDAEFGMGRQIEPYFFELAPGNKKRFFDEDQTRILCTDSFQLDESTLGQVARMKDGDRFVQLIATPREV